MFAIVTQLHQMAARLTMFPSPIAFMARLIATLPDAECPIILHGIRHPMLVCMWLHPVPRGSCGEPRSCRNILIFPRGNREVTGNTMSLYLNVADNETAPPGWSRTAKFTLSVVDQKDPEKSASKGDQCSTTAVRA